ncbi:MAG: hypothetical protein LIP23_06990, partial [Planctomycetes bacterium]|nr:hypothetical protein [Planctomycetota bacterium]
LNGQDAATAAAPTSAPPAALPPPATDAEPTTAQTDAIPDFFGPSGSGEPVEGFTIIQGGEIEVDPWEPPPPEEIEPAAEPEKKVVELDPLPQLEPPGTRLFVEPEPGQAVIGESLFGPARPAGESAIEAVPASEAEDEEVDEIPVAIEPPQGPVEFVDPPEIGGSSRPPADNWVPPPSTRERYITEDELISPPR